MKTGWGRFRWFLWSWFTEGEKRHVAKLIRKEERQALRKDEAKNG